MSTVESLQRITPRRRTRLAGTLIAAGTVIAVAVAALFIFAFAGKSTTSTAQPAAGGKTPYAPLIQYRGTGQPPTAPGAHPTSGSPPTGGLLRAEHSYGAVP
jgi:hypothetical protein